MNDQVLDADKKPAKVRYACQVNGFPEGRKADLEYALDSQGLVHVQITRRSESGRMRGKGCWPLEAIRNRDAQNLKGFVQMAKGIGINGGQLANVVEQHNHSGSAA